MPAWERKMDERLKKVYLGRISDSQKRQNPATKLRGF